MIRFDESSRVLYGDDWAIEFGDNGNFVEVFVQHKKHKSLSPSPVSFLRL